MEKFKNPEMEVVKLSNDDIESVVGGTRVEEDAIHICGSPAVGIHTPQEEADRLCSSPVVGIRTSQA